MNWKDSPMPKIHKSLRLAAIEALPHEMQEHALVDWKTVADLLAKKDVEHAREIVTNAGVPLVELSTRRKLPTWGELRKFIEARRRLATEQAAPSSFFPEPASSLSAMAALGSSSVARTVGLTATVRRRLPTSTISSPSNVVSLFMALLSFVESPPRA
jgi:hypothetical protein